MKSLRALTRAGASSAPNRSTSSPCAPSSKSVRERRSTSAFSLKISATFSADACWTFCSGPANYSSCCGLHALLLSNAQRPPKVLSQPVALLRVSELLNSPFRSAIFLKFETVCPAPENAMFNRCRRGARSCGRGQGVARPIQSKARPRTPQGRNTLPARPARSAANKASALR